MEAQLDRPFSSTSAHLGRREFDYYFLPYPLFCPGLGCGFTSPAESGKPLAITEGQSFCVSFPTLNKRMTTHQLVLLAAFAGLFLGEIGCKPRASAFPLTIQSVRELDPINQTRISFEEKGGQILVSITDKDGDAHLHRLNYEGVSKEQALEVLKQKKAELETRR